MSAIWVEDEEGWAARSPKGFPDEGTLHNLVEQAPQLLPLAGSPRLTILGREVQLGSGRADLVAVEPSGRLAVIEVKLSRSSEARRAVVTQVLTYAAHLHGLTPEQFARDVLGSHLDRRGHSSIEAAVAADDQTSSMDVEAFRGKLADSLRRGRFRLVIVLDEAPRELIELVSHLEAVTDGLIIDVIAVGAFEIGGTNVVFPQRIDAEQRDRDLSTRTESTETGLVPGADDFVAAVEGAPEDARAFLMRLVTWAQALEHEGLARLSTYHGKSGRKSLLPRLRVDDVGLVTVYRDTNVSYLQFWRSVFDRWAPRTLPVVEGLVGDVGVGQGNVTYEVSDELLAALTEAYREAARGQLTSNKE